MLGENIKACRIAAGISQEELAQQLHVVRQTVSKWETGRSVPDADVLVQLGEILNVPVQRLLDLPQQETLDLSQELARLNSLLAEKTARERLAEEAGKKRGYLLLLSFCALLSMVMLRDGLLSLVISGGCLLAAGIVLYRNLSLLTQVTAQDQQMKTLRLVTLSNLALLAGCILLGVLTAMDLIPFPENSERMFAMILIAGLMIFAGLVSPKLPFNRHVGLRLPWTVQDADTWYLAHNILGMISAPLALVYVACSLTVENFELVTGVAMALWIGIPGGLSGIFYIRKIRGH